MSFKKAVQETKGVTDCLERGLRALGSNSGYVHSTNPRLLNGSVNLDSCVAQKYPNSSRWDYIIGYKNQAYFVEVHPAHTGNITEMINKMNWLKNWLKNEGKDINSIRASKKPFRWVATKGVHIVKDSPQFLRLAQSGLSYPEKITKLK